MWMHKRWTMISMPYHVAAVHVHGPDFSQEIIQFIVACRKVLMFKLTPQKHATIDVCLRVCVMDYHWQCDEPFLVPRVTVALAGLIPKKHIACACGDMVGVMQGQRKPRANASNGPDALRIRRQNIIEPTVSKFIRTLVSAYVFCQRCRHWREQRRIACELNTQAVQRTFSKHIRSFPWFTYLSHPDFKVVVDHMRVRSTSPTNIRWVGRLSPTTQTNAGAERPSFFGSTKL